ncbi:MAG: caspase family protein [Ardenticatenaceae bacterium]|nr:caspase family protein [Ardenticatenaceae bacterium]
MAKNDRDIAIVLGVNNYPATIGPLQGAVNDANDFIKWLIDPNGGNLPEENVHLIQESEDLTAVNISNKIEEVMLEKSEFLDSPVARRLYLFFSGHGISHDSEEAWLLLPKATAANYHLHSIPGKESAKALVESALFDEVILVMDCCRNQLQWRQIPPMALFVPDPIPRTPTKHCYAFAAAWGEKASEADLDSAPASNQFSGLFTTVLLRGLQGEAKTDQNGNITADTLGDYIKMKLPELAKEHKVEPQSAQVHAPEGKQIIFVALDETQKTTVEVTLPPGTTNRQWLASGSIPLNVPEEILSETLFRYQLAPNQLVEFTYLTATGEHIEILKKIPPMLEGEVLHVS